MILGQGTQHVEILISPLDDGDFVITVRARVRHFAGAVDTIIPGAEWAAFLHALRELERRRHGEAKLEDIAARELRLWIGATDRAGHMAVAGELRDATVPEGAELLLRFGPVSFDPSALVALLAELTDFTPASKRDAAV